MTTLLLGKVVEAFFITLLSNRSVATKKTDIFPDCLQRRTKRRKEESRKVK